MVDQLKVFGVDRYVLTARLRPAFLTLLPMFVLAAAWLPKVWNLLAALSGLLVTCGATMLLAQIARYRGRRVEAGLGERAGRWHTAAALRHRDLRIDPGTKARYHDALRKAGMWVPTASEERADALAADGAYRGCATWLLEQTRDRKRFPLLVDENIDYGFRRNMLGLKWFAVPILLGSLIGDLAVAYVRWNGLDLTFWTAMSLAAGMALGLAAWLWIVDAAFVQDASEAYAVRLLAACDSLGPTQRASARKRRPAAESPQGA